MKKLQIVLCTALLTTGITTVMAANNTNKGANPNGKPFIEIQGQIIEIEGEVSTLQDQVDALVDDVDDLTLRIDANESAISSLQTVNVNLQNQIDTNASDITSLQNEVGDLKIDNIELWAQIDDLGDADGSLADAIAANLTTITTMNISITDMSVSLQNQIDHNNQLILTMQDQVDNLNLISGQATSIENGVCPDGETVSSYRTSPPRVNCFRRYLGPNGDVEYPVAYSTVTINPGRVLHTRPGCDGFTGVPYVRNFGYSQSGGVEIISFVNQTRNFDIRYRNTTNEVQVVNVEVECSFVR